MTTPLEKTTKRINDAAVQNYAPYALAKRKPRGFRYSDRRMYKATKWYAVAARAGSDFYCRFLGPSGVTLAAPTSDTTPVLTFVRYPVSYRRRMRYINDFAISVGEDDGTNMTVYFGSLEEANKYVSLVSDKTGCVAAAELGDKMAQMCCNANEWEFTPPNDASESSSN